MTYLLRFLTYITRNVVIVSVIAVVCFYAFFVGMNLTNIYIVLKDGMQMRAAVALRRADAAELTKFYTTDYLAADTVYRSAKYETYTIRGFEHNLEIERMWCWPWATTATASVSEYIMNIDGELPVERQTPEQLKLNQKIPPPPWDSARYSVILVQKDGQWLIGDLRKQQNLPMPTPTPPRPAPKVVAAMPGASTTPLPPGSIVMSAPPTPKSAPTPALTASPTPKGTASPTPSRKPSATPKPTATPKRTARP